MRKIVLFLSLCCIAIDGFSQVGINTTSPNAQLDIRSSNQVTPTNKDGILIPKIDAFPTTNPTAAQQGMMVYLTTISAGKTPDFTIGTIPEHRNGKALAALKVGILSEIPELTLL